MKLKETFARFLGREEKNIQLLSFSTEQLKKLHSGKSVIFQVNGEEFELCKVFSSEKDKKGRLISETFLLSDETGRTIGKFTFDCLNYCWYENYDFQEKKGNIYRKVLKQLNAQKEEGEQAFHSANLMKTTNQDILETLNHSD